MSRIRPIQGGRGFCNFDALCLGATFFYHILINATYFVQGMAMAMS